MTVLPFQSGGRRIRKRPSPSLTTIAAITALAAGAGYLMTPAGVSIGWPRHLLGFGASEPLAPGPSGPSRLAGLNPAMPPAHKTADTTPVTIAGTASVIDGDTLQIHAERIRLAGVDALNLRQQCRDADGKFWSCGQAVADALTGWIAGNPLSCKTHGRDARSRVLATCTVRGENLQSWLVSQGYVLAHRQSSTAYAAAEDKAREEKIGIWAGEFVPPSDWRKGLRLDGETPAKTMSEAKVAAN